MSIKTDEQFTFYLRKFQEISKTIIELTASLPLEENEWSERDQKKVNHWREELERVYCYLIKATAK